MVALKNIVKKQASWLVEGCWGFGGSTKPALTTTKI